MPKSLHAVFGIVLLATLLIASHGCADSVQVLDPPAPDQPAAGPGPELSAFRERILEIAQTYESYGRIGSVLPGEHRLPAGTMRGGPWLPDPLFSDSGYGPTHGRRLYSLFVKERQPGPYDESYTVEGKPSPVGQVVVEEAWFAGEMERDGKPLESATRKVIARHGGRVQDPADWYMPYGWLDGRWYQPTRKMGLFIIFKLDAKTPGTDAGWVYGTVAADGKTVGPVGRVATCMACHDKAPHDHLFGLREQ
jgi:hypothetical protein